MHTQPSRPTEEAAATIYRLLVSNSPLILSQLRWGGFRRVDLRTTVVGGGEEVLEALRAGSHDAVVLQARLADGDAFDLCSRIRGEHGHEHLPVVVISEHGLTQDLLSRIAASGCDEVLSVPLSRGQLYHVLAEHLDLPRRRNYRVRIKARVAARGTFMEVAGEVYDLALSGARIRLDEPFGGEALLTVAIEAPDGELELSASVVWHRPHAGGAELAVQFRTVSEEVAQRLETLATWRIDRQEGQQVVVLQRSLNERSNFSGLAEQLRGHVVFDLRHLSLIASAGVGAWVAFLRQIPAEVTYELTHCPVSFCVQASYVADMLGRGRVSTFYAPYLCAGCNSEVERELTSDSVEITSPQEAPELHCGVCGEALEFEDLPERYFKFLKPAQAAAGQSA